MNTQISEVDSLHQQVLMLLPWYVNQSLELGERRRVENHIRSCMACRREMIQLEKLALAVKQTPDLDIAAEASFDKLKGKLQASLPKRTSVESAEVVTFSRSEFKQRASFTRWHQSVKTVIANYRVGLALAASITLVTIPVILHLERSPADFYTLSDSRPEASGDPTLRVVFNKDVSDGEIEALLGKIHGYRLTGPNSMGAYTVRLSSNEYAPSRSAAIDFLRSQRGVLLAEPVLN